jgi:hypothetical protein
MSSQPSHALEHGAVPWLLAGALATAGPHAGHLPPWLSLLVASACSGAPGCGNSVARCHRAGRWPAGDRLASRHRLAIPQPLRQGTGVALLVLFMALKPLETHQPA